MRLDRVDLNLLVVLNTIYTERNLTKAAKILCLSQPAVSNALTRLRKTLDDELFIRTPTGMTPTPLSDNIIVRVREALSLMNEVLSDNEKFIPELSTKTFRFSMSDFAQSLILPELMIQFQLLAPRMAIESYYLPRKDQRSAMEAGQLDLAIDVPLLQDNKLLHNPLLCDSYVCVMNIRHPARKEPLTLKKYLELQHLHVSSRPKGRGQVDLELHKLSKVRQIKLRVANYLIAQQVIKNSLLVATVPISLAKHLNLPYLPMPFDIPALELHLCWHKNAQRDPANIWLRELVSQLPVLNLGK
jgi:DNA-binding transcriptional LysR family regulator